MTSPDEHLVEALRCILLDAGRIAARGFLELVQGIELKIDGSPVSQTDREIDLFLAKALRPLVRHSGWLSEESDDDEARLQAEYVWIVDPLDGTKEFVKRVPEFAISVGLVHQGRAILGGILNPVTGEGAVGHVGGPLKIWGFDGLQARSRAKRLQEAKVSFSRTELEAGRVSSIVGAFGQSCAIGSVAYKLLRVVVGCDDLTVSVYPKSEWDICGGVALLESAHLSYRRFDGKPLQFNSKNPRIDCGAVAGPQHLVEEFLEMAPEF